MPSYELINYSLRPAKHIERKMMLEVIRTLSVFGSLTAYRYIGFGSIYFSDFYLFHKQLGINEMISVEKEQGDEGRFNFNRPFSCIQIQFGYSTDILPSLSWDTRTIIWLDYDGTLNKDVIADIRFASSNLAMGSMLIITVNAEPEKDTNAERGVDLLRDRVGENNLPVGIENRDLRKWGTAAAYRRIITNQIHEALSDKNGVRRKGNKVLYQQLFHFNYADGMKMLTVGGILYDEGQRSLFPLAHIEETFPFVKTGEEPYLIRVPNLTYREIRHLDKLLPGDKSSLEKEANIPQQDVEYYAKTYRYFPTFAETDF